jgi:hypothetical protein
MYTSYFDYIEKSKTHQTKFDVTKFTLDLNGVNLGIELPHNYNDIVSNISKIVHDKLNNGDVSDDALLVKINNMLDVPEVIQLGEHFAKELSDKLYGTKVVVEHLHTYKNKITTQKEHSSWLWHYDNCAVGQIKIMVYLTPTTQKNGAFLTLVSSDSFYTLCSTKTSPTSISPPIYEGSRIPISKIEELKANGFFEYYVEGDLGTFIVFSQNIAHKATIPIEEPERICMIYNFRPYHKKLETYINKEITHDWNFDGDVKIYNYEL